LSDKLAEIKIEEEKDNKYDETLEVLMKNDDILKYCIENNKKQKLN
tara:strand:- start:223 stop:360 length:138 start_codon:yes stop_codon:yes gene_type:complete